MKNISTQIAEHVVNVSFDSLSQKAIEATKRSILDAIGVTLGASGLGEGCKAFVELATSAGGNAEASIIGHGIKVPMTMAALANGAMAHALDFEDAYDGAPVHPNAATVPAALAVAEAIGNVSGKQLITAIATGCDLVCRLGLSLQENMDDNGWYPPPMLSAYGATAAAAKLMNLNAAQIIDAFSLTLCQSTCSAELKVSPKSSIRAVRDAFATQAAVQSAYLANKGVRGFDQPFEGGAGFFALYAHGHYDAALLTENLGKKFHGEDISFKPWPACRGTHAFIEAALHLVKTHAIKPDNIAHIKMTGSKVQKMLVEPTLQKQKPSTAIDAKFSLPFTVATALINQTVNLRHYFSDALHDAEVLKLAQRMSYVVDEKFSMTAGLLEIQMRDGAVHRKQIDQPYGHPSNAMNDEDLIKKFMDCAGYAAKPIVKEKLVKLVESIWTLDSVTNIGSSLFNEAF